MRVDRRDFLRISGISALTAWGCSTPLAGTLRIEFRGLMLLEQQQRASTIHLVDGPALGLGEHVPQLRVASAVIDQSKTTKPDPAHIMSLGGTEFWIWDLKGVNVAAPSRPTGESNLTLNDTPVDSEEIPANDAAWKSLGRVPNLRTLSGATKIVKKDALTSAITLTHGHLEALKPDQAAGQFAIWKFTHPDGHVLMRRALTDKLIYTCPTEGQALTMNIGSHAVVFQPGANPEVTVTNLLSEQSRAQRAQCPAPCEPNINHFASFFSLVDAQFTPSGTLDSFKRPPDRDVEPDYCPPGRI